MVARATVVEGVLFFLVHGSDELIVKNPPEQRKAKSGMISVLHVIDWDESQNLILDLIHHYSDLSKLLRITSYVFRFLYSVFKRLCQRVNKIVTVEIKVLGLPFITFIENYYSHMVSPQELEKSQFFWVYFLQHHNFCKKIKIIKESQGKTKVSRDFAKLNPFIQDDFLRVDGRLRKSSLDLDCKHP